jgi:hypothetical protein
MCETAGLVEKGQRSGLNLHRARHWFALEMRRAVSLEAASQALGHADLSTTMRHYGTGRGTNWRTPSRLSPPPARAGNDSPGVPRKPASLAVSWRRGESNPRPRSHRTEHLQA